MVAQPPILNKQPKWIFIFFIAVYFSLGAYSVFAADPIQQVQITSSPNPLGSGARAIGMGSAFIAVADDATAASWNPAGLIQLETPEMSVVFDYSRQTEHYRSEPHPEINGSNLTTPGNLNYFSGVYPFHLLGKNMVVSLNYQHLYGMDNTLNFDYRDVGEVAPGLPYDITHKVQFEVEGGLKAFSPAYAVQLTEDISIGMTFNFWKDMTGGNNGWKENYRSRRPGQFVGNTILSTFNYENKYSNFRGFNYNIGVMWNVTDIITFGAVFKSGFTGKMDHHYRSVSTQTFPGLGLTEPTVIFEEEDKVKLHMPLSYGAGLSFRLSDEFTMAFDFYRTEWGSYYFQDANGNKTSPIDGRPISESNIQATTQFHLGAEHLFILENTIVPVRGGIFMDPEPTEGNQDNFYGFSLGTGISIDNMVFDFAYQFRHGNEVRESTIGLSNTNADVTQHKFYFSAIYYF